MTTPTTAPAAKAAKPEAAASPRMLHTFEIKLEEQARTRFGVAVSGLESAEEALSNPMLLTRAYDRIKVGDAVTMWSSPDLSWYVECIVVSRDPVSKAIALKAIVGPIAVGEADRLTPDLKHAVVEQAGTSWRVRYSHEVLADSFETRHRAEKWLTERRDRARKNG